MNNLATISKDSAWSKPLYPTAEVNTRLPREPQPPLYRPTYASSPTNRADQRDAKPYREASLVKPVKQQVWKERSDKTWDRPQTLLSGNQQKPLLPAAEPRARVAVAEKLLPTYVHRIADVHADDIHCLIYNGQQIVSGSKDTQLKVWSQELDCQSVILNENVSGDIDYQRWVTAVRTLGDGNWIAGDRKGFLRQFDSKNILEASVNVDVSNHVSKKRNHDRISCFGTINDNNGIAQKILVGVAKSIQIWHRDTLKNSSETIVSKNDWVHCIEHFRENHYLLVIGTSLEMWSYAKNAKNKWEFAPAAALHRELPSEINFVGGKPQRPFISAIEFFDPSTLGMVDFSGRIKILDMNTGALCFNHKGHLGRVWSVKKCQPNVFATSADDRTVKLWDLRTHAEVSTFHGHSGRVSNILPIQDHNILVTSCPDDVKKNHEKASFTIWDCRL